MWTVYVDNGFGWVEVSAFVTQDEAIIAAGRLLRNVHAVKVAYED